jgi:hypothetical protein
LICLICDLGVKQDYKGGHAWFNKS